MFSDVFACVVCGVQHDDLDLCGDGGVSKAMATVFSVQHRLPFLLTHGMVHLMGYDHEHEEEWVRMTRKEDEVLGALAVEFPDLIPV
jgi:probable rRNA maturation factor